MRRYIAAAESWIQGGLSPLSASTERFQYVSDLHLEVGQQYLTFDFEVTAPNLILAGDIGRLVDYDGYLAFLQKQTVRYDRVFLVLGNHEFYGLSFESGLDQARALEKEPSLQRKLVLLQQKSCSSFDQNDQVVVVGCPLWSLIPTESAKAIAAVVNDFNKIEGWSVEKHNTAHAQDLVWLQNELQAIQRYKPKARVIVVTHYAPLLGQTASPKHKDSPIQSAFATDLLRDARAAESWTQVKYWIFGHTHWTTQLKVNGIRVISNQRGYVFPGNNVRLLVEQQAAKHTFDSKRIIQV